MEFIIGFLAVSFIWGILKQLFSGSGDQNSHYHHEVNRLIDQGLTVSCTFEDIAEPTDRTSLFIARLNVSGSVVVPQDHHPVNWLVQVVDETEGEDSRYALLCEIPECADAESYYEFRQDSHIPYTVSEFEDINLTNIPLFALIGPKKGPRKWRIFVMVADATNDDQLYALGSQLIDYRQEHVGYTEWAAHTKAQEGQIAVLTLAMAAADGSISKRETSIIRNFFSERFQHLEEPDERKQHITYTLQSTLSDLKSGHKAVDFIKNTCRSLKADNDQTVIQTAYELCTKVAVADESFEANEQKALKYIATQLEIDPEYVREVHDREIRLHMYSDQHNDRFILLGMPGGLSTVEQRAWLQSEYEKWRPRQSHPDTDIATEATLRVDQIVDALTSLDQESNDNPADF